MGARRTGRLTGLDRKRLASRVLAEGPWTLDADGRVDGWFAGAPDFLWSGQLAETAEDIPTTGELSDHFGVILSWERVRAIRTWLVAELARDILADEFGIGDTSPFASPLLVRGAAATVIPALAGFCRTLRPGPVDVSGSADASLALAAAD